MFFLKGHDWAIIKLGIPGSIHGFDVDTSFFIGNFPPRISIQAAILTPERNAQYEYFSFNRTKSLIWFLQRKPSYQFADLTLEMKRT